MNVTIWERERGWEAVVAGQQLAAQGQSPQEAFRRLLDVCPGASRARVVVQPALPFPVDPKDVT